MGNNDLIGKWERVLGDERVQLSERLAALYQDEHLSIRQIAERTGRSYGAVYQLLTEAEVTFRPRGRVG
jgi:predicted transcriptional regulator